ncbi:hypothetical protein BU17DRAFT_95556 [Hysterangium stoloniferum]|nr:hypothetical protein BU17DRAFT_95556 [Hysterangium stoloniferum]
MTKDKDSIARPPTDNESASDTSRTSNDAPGTNPKPNTVTTDPLHNFKPEPASAPPLSRGHRITKPSAYVQQIREGEGSHTGLNNSPTFPVGLQTSKEVNTYKETGAIAKERLTADTNNNVKYAMLASSPNDPMNFEEAAYGPQKDIWIPAMLEELERMRANGT